jgi:hypothetical protein
MAQPDNIKPTFKPRSGSGDVVVEHARPEVKALRSTTLPDFIQRKPLPWIIKGILPRYGTGIDYGAPSSGKTFSAFDLAMTVARGAPWYGHKVKRCGVVYILAEGSAGFINRVKAYLAYHHLEADSLSFEIIDEAVDLLTSAQLDEIIVAIKDASERIGPVGLVIVDTLNRTMAGGDENSSEDMSAYIRNVQYLADTVGAFVLVVHHSGKDASKGSRGHSCAKGNIDIEIEVTDDAGAHTLTVRKNRDGEAGACFGFRLEQVQLGEDEDGDPITSCVVIPTDTPKPASRQRALSGVARVALMALNEAILDHGQVMPATSTIPQGVRSVTLDQWRERFVLRYGREHDRNSTATRQAFGRGKEALLKSEHIAISDPFVWPCRP